MAPPLPSEPTPYTNAADSAAPAIATQMYPTGEESPKNATAVTTASDAPMLTPRMPGSASGLRVTPCITAPARPSAAPISTASTVRGIRLTAAACSRVVSEPPSAAQTSDQPTALEPNATEATISAASTTTAARSHSGRARTGRRTTAASGVRRAGTVVT